MIGPRLFVVWPIMPVLALVWLSATATEKTVMLLSGGVACAMILWLTLAWLHLADANCKRLWPACTRAVVAIAVIVSVMATNWPLHLTFAFSRSALQRMAEAVQAGQQQDGPIRVGFFVIKERQVSRRGGVYLWTELNPSVVTQALSKAPCPATCGRSSNSTTNGAWCRRIDIRRERMC